MLHSIFSYTAIFVCLFWAVLLLKEPKKDKKHPKRIISVLMLVVAAFYTTFVALYSGDKLLYRYFDEIFVFSSLCIFPVYYLYIVSLTKETIHQKKYIWHYAPAVFFLFLYIILSSRLTNKEYENFILNFIHSKSIVSFSLSNRVSQLEIVFLIFRLFYLVQIFTYLILALRLSVLWKTRLKNSLSETVGKEIQQIKFLSIVEIIVIVCAYFIDSFGTLYVPESSLILLLPMFLSSPVLFRIGQIAYEQDYTVYDLEKVEKKAESVESAVYHQNLSKLRQNLEILMNENKIFLTKDLKITSVCEKLHTNRTYLSEVLNNQLKENFNSYINKHRVEYAISLLNDFECAHYTIDKIAELSGFGSTVSMIRAFKQIKGKTPSEFRV